MADFATSCAFGANLLEIIAGSNRIVESSRRFAGFFLYDDIYCLVFIQIQGNPMEFDRVQ